VNSQRDPPLAENEDWVDGGEPEHAAPGRACRHHEQTVVAAGPEPAHSPHRIPAEPVWHKPLALGSSIEIATELPPKPHGGKCEQLRGA
jgi:hypothetical protein